MSYLLLHLTSLPIICPAQTPYSAESFLKFVFALLIAYWTDQSCGAVSCSLPLAVIFSVAEKGMFVVHVGGLAFPFDRHCLSCLA